MTTTIELIGISGDRPSSRASEALSICTTAVASGRHAHIAGSRGLEIIPIAPVSAMLDLLETALNRGNVAVLASGDPLFFGVGRTLLSRFGHERLNIHPALSSMQLACARFRIPWDDMKFISLHGREPENTASTVLSAPKTAIFTDSRNSPDAISRLILDKIKAAHDTETANHIRVYVAENLGLPQERLVTGSLEDIASRSFTPMNIMLVIYDESWIKGRFQHDRTLFGLNEPEILHSRGLITKDEVRAVTLHKLRLPAHGCFWDIGAGSGSVSIEAAGMCPALAVYSIEQEPTEQENIRKNIRKFRTWNINLIPGVAPEALIDLPSPDRVFIGGSGGRLQEIIQLCSKRLAPAGRIVVNAVLSQTAQNAPLFMQKVGLNVSEVKISVERFSQPSEGSEPGRKLNPITIITGIK